MFEKKLKEYVKEITDSWRVDTPFHTTRYWTFKHKGTVYCVSRATRSFTQDTSYCFSQELGNKNVPLEQKKSMLGVYGTACNAATIITKACVVELAYDRMGKEL